MKCKDYKKRQAIQMLIELMKRNDLSDGALLEVIAIKNVLRKEKYSSRVKAARQKDLYESNRK